MTLRISSNFDSGAIEVLSIDTPDNIRLRLRADQGIASDSSFRQWFHFRLHGAAGLPVRMVFENASEAAYPDGWPGYRCVASYDRHHWFRITGTRYENGQLIVEHTPERNGIYYAYFEPYSHERHLDLLGRVEMSPFASVSNLGATVDGRDLGIVAADRHDDVEGFNRKVYLSVPLRTYADVLQKGDKIIFTLNTYKEGMTSRSFTY